MFLLNTLDWLLIALSLFNTITMLWLGLTVLINAERRSWGTWAAGGGLLFGGVFFLGHSAVVGRVLGTFSNEMEFWWLLGWLVLPGAPYLWYLVMAWYSGALRSSLHRVLVAAVGLLGILAIVSLLVGNPLPSYEEVLRNGRGMVANGSWNLALLYPLYSTCCIALALYALRRPAPSERFMGDQARQRARPWLVAASVVLLAVSLAVGGGAALFLELARLGSLPPINMLSLGGVIAFDLLITFLIAVAVVLIGQAVVAYEIFTGGALPSGALARRWRRSLIFAAGYGLVVGWSMSGAAGPVEPIYQVLLGLLVSVVFVALLGWRSDAERERTVERLRPFVTSQHMYEQLLDPSQISNETLALAPFEAIASTLLGAERAYLLPLGPLEPLIGPGLALPPSYPLPLLNDQRPTFDPATLCVPVAPTAYGGATWAVPLWGERGLIGVLLLGEKRNSGLYTREELEVARAASERLLDSQASAEIARRLVALQRRRLAESQVLDRRARRVLHDEILPQIHTTILQLADNPQSPDLSTSNAWAGLPISNLQSIHNQIANLLKELPAAPSTDVAMVGLLGALRGGVAEFASSFDRIDWQIAPAAESIAQELSPLNAEVIFYAAREGVRNAARYGRGSEASRPLHLCIYLSAHQFQLELTIEDNGVGIDAMRSNGTTPARGMGGSGRGLALHGTMMAIIGGTLSIESSPGQYTRMRLRVPVGT
jgi:signal transduction histidine kinase